MLNFKSQIVIAAIAAIALTLASCDKTVGSLPYVEPDPFHGVSEDDIVITYTRTAPLKYAFSAQIKTPASSSTVTWEISDPGLAELYSTTLAASSYFPYTFHAEGEAKVTFSTMKVNGIDGYVKDHSASITLHVY